MHSLTAFTQEANTFWLWEAQGIITAHLRAQPCLWGCGDMGSALPTDGLSWTQLSAHQHTLQTLGHWGITGEPLGNLWGSSDFPAVSSSQNSSTTLVWAVPLLLS